MLKSLYTTATGMKAQQTMVDMIANNIANVNTPGYQRIEVSFESELRKALDPRRLMGARTDEAHMPIGKPNLSLVR